jgi:putative ABC transport system substrate-binding protein
MDRRRFLLTSLSGALAAPLAAEAQERGRVPRVGVLGPRTRADAAPFVDGFLRGLRERGWVDGKISASSIASRMASTTGYPILRPTWSASRWTSFWQRPRPRQWPRGMPRGRFQSGTSSDPVELGLAGSLARPGGNVTGLSFSFDLELVGKELELLKEVVPNARRRFQRIRGGV